MSTTLGITVNTKNFAPSQYAGFNYNSACVFNGKVLFAGTSGILTNEGSNDAGVAISAYFQVPSASGNNSNRKRFRRVKCSGYFSGAMIVSVVTHEDVATAVYTKAYDADNRTIEVPLNFTDSGEMIGMTFTNVAGSDFSFDLIQAVIIPTVIKPHASICLGRLKSDIPDLTVSASGS